MNSAFQQFRLLVVLIMFATLTACSVSPVPSTKQQSDKQMPTPTWASASSPLPPIHSPDPTVTAKNRDTVRAALPGDGEVSGFTRVRQPVAIMLCPALTRAVPKAITYSAKVWSGTGEDKDQILSIVAGYDPTRSITDSLINTLMQTCPEDTKKFHYVYDRQPYEKDDGWSGVLNTTLITELRTGKQRYQVAYLISKNGAMVNVVVIKDNQTVFDPAVDEAAASFLEAVLKRFAV